VIGFGASGKESNLRPDAYKATALPTELRRRTETSEQCSRSKHGWLSITLASLCLAACQSMPPKPAMTEYRDRLIYPTVDLSLMCAPEPAVPAGITTDAAALAWAEDVRKAGQECRKNLEAVRDFVAKWPKE
jgi:hypothetical protein